MVVDDGDVGLAGSYGQLALTRIGVGIGEASASPAAYLPACGLFSGPAARAGVSIYTSGLYVGAALSLPLGGWIAHAWNRSYPHGMAPFALAGWQVAFLAVAAPGLLLALWVLTLREPVRGLAEGRPSLVVRPGAWSAFARELAAILPPLTLWSVARFPGALRRNLLLLTAIGAVTLGLARLTGDAFQWGSHRARRLRGDFLGPNALRNRPAGLHPAVRTRAIVLALGGFGAIAFFSYALFWGTPYAMRTFGVGSDVAGPMLGIPAAFASAASSLTGGYLADLWKRRDPRGRIFVCMLAIALPTPLLYAALEISNVKIFYFVYPLITFVAFLWVAPAAAAIQDCVLPRMRGTAAAIFILALSILGLGLGPYCTGKVAAITGSLRLGMLSAIAVTPLALLLLWRAGREIGVAEDTREERARAAGEPC